MGRISNYSQDTDVTKSDKLLGSDSGGSTKNFSLESVSDFFKNEIDCPSNIGIQCIDCKLCNGSKQAKNITIEAHGARAGGIAYA